MEGKPHAVFSELTYLNTFGWHLRRLIKDEESIPPAGKRVVTDEVLSIGLLELPGVEMDTSVRILKNLVAPGRALLGYIEKQVC